MAPLLITLDAIVRGDTWTGFPQIGPIMEDGVAPIAALANVTMTFKHSKTDLEPQYVLVSGTPAAGQGQITILDTQYWTIAMPAQALPLPAGTSGFDIQFVDVAGNVLTPIMGTIFVYPDYTRN